MRPATLLKKRLWHRCFPVNFVNFLRTFLLQNTSEPLLSGCDYCIFTVAVYSKIERNCLELLAPFAILCLWDIFFKFIFTFCFYLVSIIFLVNITSSLICQIEIKLAHKWCLQKQSPEPVVFSKTLVWKNFSKFSGIFYRVSLNGSFCALEKYLKQVIKGVLKIFTKL